MQPATHVRVTNVFRYCKKKHPRAAVRGCELDRQGDRQILGREWWVPIAARNDTLALAALKVFK